MRALTPTSIGLLLLAFYIGPFCVFYLRKRRRKKEQQLGSEGLPKTASTQAIEDFMAVHRRIAGLGFLGLGIYLSTLEGSMTRFVLPGFHAVGGGAATGAAECACP